MSTTLSGPAAVKKISSWVRPGVREMRARFLRPASGLSRLDLPTLERPESAISVPRMAGSETAEPAAAAKSHSPANRRRPASSSSRVNLSIGAVSGDAEQRCGRSSEQHVGRLRLRLLLHEQRLDVVDQFD